MIKKLTGKKKLTINSIVSRKPRRDVLDDEDLAYLRSNRSVELGEEVGVAGHMGRFYKIAGNERLGVKVPKCKFEDGGCSVFADPHVVCKDCENKRDVIREAQRFNETDAKHIPFLAGTKIVTVKRDGKKCIGLARPVVKEIDATNIGQLTTSQIEHLRQQLIGLSRHGVMFGDGLQFGFTHKGKALQFDLEHTHIGTVTLAFNLNEEMWFNFLDTVLAPEFAKCRKLYPDRKERIPCNKKILDKYYKSLTR